MSLFAAATPALRERVVHLDLKGLPPTPARMLEILELLAACRVTGVLLEWEDAFPWRDRALRSPTAYTPDEVAALVARAHELELELIPLVQCFGHLQNVLLQPGYAHLRERPESSADCCPSHPEAGPLLRGLIDELIAAHPHARRIHLGCDEVRSLGTCARCHARVGSEGAAGVFRAHVEPLLAHAAEHGLRALVWDDMLRDWDTPAVAAIAAAADLVCWDYQGTPVTAIGPDVLERFESAGAVLWAGSAFRGADFADADQPDVAARIRNLTAWVTSCRERGIERMIATGWARYDTAQVPCESLEVSLDALVLAAAAMWDGELPTDAAQQAEALLIEGDLAPWAGEGFRSRRHAARELAAWRTETWPLAHLLHQCPVAGEAERHDLAALTTAATGLRRHVERGEALTAAWTAAHAGVVDDHWLRRYADARLVFARQIAAPLAAQYAGEEPRAASVSEEA